MNPTKIERLENSKIPKMCHRCWNYFDLNDLEVVLPTINKREGNRRLYCRKCYRKI